MKFKRKGDKSSYIFLDADCIGRKCWQPGMYQHRAPTLSGSRNTGSPDTPCCMFRAYHGCPDGPVGAHDDPDPKYGTVHTCGVPVFDPELARKRKAEGWKRG